MKEIVELSEKKITLERNEFLKVKGSIDTDVYYVESGTLRVFVLDDFEEQIIRFSYEGNLITSLVTGVCEWLTCGYTVSGRRRIPQRLSFPLS